MSELDLIFNRKKREEKPSQEERIEKREEAAPQTTVTENKTVENITEQQKVEEIMKKFVNKDPKIGIWSYPAYLLLQYLYNTIPGFKMSKTAKDALERGLKEMYPDLYQIAEKVARESGKIE